MFTSMFTVCESDSHKIIYILVIKRGAPKIQKLYEEEKNIRYHILFHNIINIEQRHINNVRAYLLSISNNSLLSDPGQARGCSTYTFASDSVN